MIDDHVTPVLFRIGIRKDDKAVTAILPCEPHDMEGHCMTCYVHVGQHGACSFKWYHDRNAHRRATPEEYADLKKELEGLGYVLKVYQKIHPFMYKAFRKEVSRLNARSA